MDKHTLYTMMVRQLIDDGFMSAAAAVADATFTSQSADVPAQRLQQLVVGGLRMEGGVNGVEHLSTRAGDDEMGEDMEGMAPDTPRAAVDAPVFETRFITTHKQTCRAATFSGDGMLIATASADTSIKLLDVSKVVQCAVAGKVTPLLPPHDRPTTPALPC
jgi:cleavage stimulation factor subunit 1